VGSAAAFDEACANMEKNDGEDDRSAG